MFACVLRKKFQGHRRAGTSIILNTIFKHFWGSQSQAGISVDSVPKIPLLKFDEEKKPSPLYTLCQHSHGVVLGDKFPLSGERWAEALPGQRPLLKKKSSTTSLPLYPSFFWKVDLKKKNLRLNCRIFRRHRHCLAVLD